MAARSGFTPQKQKATMKELSIRPKPFSEIPSAPKSVKRAFSGLLLASILLLRHNAAANPTPVDLGSASDFAILAGSGITIGGPAIITGDIGTYPSPPTVTGLANATFVTGSDQTANTGVMMAAQNALTTAFNAATAQGSSPTMSYGAVNFGGDTLTAGVYSASSSIGITGTLTLDAANNPNAVWIFLAGSSLTTAAGSAGDPLSSVILENGAQASNVFWIVDTSATLGTYSDFVGNILASASITANTGATVDGRLLAESGLVTLGGDTTVAAPLSSPTSPTPPGVPDVGGTLPMLFSGLAALFGIARRSSST
jgi:hypothetical protein